jgi:NACHT domain
MSAGQRIIGVMSRYAIQGPFTHELGQKDSPVRSDRSSPASAASLGGRANEAGSLYRSGVAAYLAAHGLASRGVEAAGYAAKGPTPVRLSFETGEAVDDIRCELADDTILRVQAKRRCGDDRHLAATVEQWVGQVMSIRTGDMLGLATGEPTGPVRDLGRALDRLRRSVPGSCPPGEGAALAAVKERFPVGTSGEEVDRVLRSALVMTVSASSPRDEGFRSVANLLDGTVVAAGMGTAAVEALQRAFYEQAAAGTGSGVDDWLQILERAHLPVFADAAGPAGPRRQAELDAVAAYRARLAARDGVLEYSLLADDLPAMTYKPLAESLRASVPGQEGSDWPFLGLVRRWPRMLLTGLPGIGKSTALEQAAARWAVDTSAPIPVVVPLREIARRNPRSSVEITLAALIEAASAGAPEAERIPLLRALGDAALSGNAVMLLDGLDECQDHRAIVADGLATVIRELHPNTGVVLATRESGLAAAARLRLPEARLIEPHALDLALAELMRHAARYRVPADLRGQWVGQREHQLEEIMNRYADLFRIPLFAVLLALLLAARAPSSIPRGKGRLLETAVRATVERWELKRRSETSTRPYATAGQLLDGFCALSHACLSKHSDHRADNLSREVEAMLILRWGLAPGPAHEQAREIMWFWDEHVGVFVASAKTGEVEPRSRVFAEIGEAMWAASLDREDLQAWLATALQDDGCSEQVVFACSLSGSATRELLSAAAMMDTASPRARALLWAADAIAEGAEAPPESMAPSRTGNVQIRTLGCRGLGELQAGGCLPLFW